MSGPVPGWPRLAVLPGALNGAGGGAARSAAVLARAFAARGRHVIVEALDDGSPRAIGSGMFASCDMRVHRSVETPTGPASNALLRRIQHLAPALDIAHLNGHWNPMNHAVAGILREYEVPYLISSRATTDRAAVALLGTSVRESLLEAEREYVAGAYGVHLTSDCEVQRAEFAFPPREVILQPNPVDLQHLVDVPSRAEARSTLGVPQAQEVLLFYGRLVAQKNPGFAVQVLAQIGRQSDVHLYLVGSKGDAVDEVRQEIEQHGLEDRVHFVGQVSGPDRGAWLAAADVMLLPSWAENFSLGLVEAVASGLAVVSAPEVGALEYLLPGEVVVVELDPVAWAEACRNLRSRRPVDRREPFLRLWDQFRPERIAEAWEREIYLVSPRRPDRAGLAADHPASHELVMEWVSDAWTAAGALPPVQLSGSGPSGASERSLLRWQDSSGLSVLSMTGSPVQGDYTSVPFDSTADLDWVVAARLLSSLGLPVPEVLGYEPQRRWVLVEDLGETTLANRLGFGFGPTDAHLFEDALALLVRLQAASARLPADSLPARRPLDVQALAWEMWHAVDWAVEARLGRLVPARDALALAKQFELMARFLDSGPRVLVHRDFHAGNIAVCNDGSLAMLDLDDLCIGNAFYDLSTLLIDGSRRVDFQLVDVLVERHHALLSAVQNVPGLEDWRRGFDVQAIARCLKAAGRFCWLADISGRTEYLSGVHHVIEAGAVLLARRPEFAAVRAQLSRLEPAFAGEGLSDE